MPSKASRPKTARRIGAPLRSEVLIRGRGLLYGYGMQAAVQACSLVEAPLLPPPDTHGPFDTRIVSGESARACSY